MSDMSFAGDWYHARRIDDDVTLIWESKIVPAVRCNIWHIRGRDRDLLIDSGFGIVPASPAHSFSDRQAVARIRHPHSLRSRRRPP